MKRTTEIEVGLVCEALSYDPETGTLVWKNRPSEHFANERIAAAVNSRCAGNKAIHRINGHGYRTGTFLGRKVSAHRLAFVLMTGRWPKEIDHINGNRADNRWVNLREVTPRENHMNQKRPKNNTSGHLGVSWSRSTGKWQAYIHSKGRLHHLGFFCALTLAVDARKDAERRLGFHENHGREAA